MDRMPLPAGSYRIIFSLISFGSLYGVSGNDLHPWRVGGSGVRRVTETARANDTEQFAAVSSAIYPVRAAPGVKTARCDTYDIMRGLRGCTCIHVLHGVGGDSPVRAKRGRDSVRGNKLRT